ncbi:hypothetical protein LEA_14491, partial [human gut metagenome]
YTLGAEIKADIFAAGDKVDASAISKVRASRAQSRDSDSTEDLWLMVPSSIVIRVPMVHVPPLAVYSRARECLDIWVV